MTSVREEARSEPVPTREAMQVHDLADRLRHIDPDTWLEREYRWVMIDRADVRDADRERGPWTDLPTAQADAERHARKGRRGKRMPRLWCLEHRIVGPVEGRFTGMLLVDGWWAEPWWRWATTWDRRLQSFSPRSHEAPGPRTDTRSR